MSHANVHYAVVLDEEVIDDHFTDIARTCVS